MDLAIISAGETDMETARITCLHTSCLGFAPLIFDLKSSFGFNDLIKTCEPVWNAVDADPSLPTKLVCPLAILYDGLMFRFIVFTKFKGEKNHLSVGSVYADSPRPFPI